jgi:hypothetical protein
MGAYALPVVVDLLCGISFQSESAVEQTATISALIPSSIFGASIVAELKIRSKPPSPIDRRESSKGFTHLDHESSALSTGTEYTYG